MFPGRLCVLVCFKAVLALATDMEAAETIAGRVRDASGAAIAKADIVLATPELTVIAASVSDAQGSFSMPAPAPGSYLLIARAPAFGETRQAVTVLAGKTAPIEIVLEVGPLEEEVTVAATRDSVDALRVSAQPVNVITGDEIAARVKTVVAQAVEAETGVHLQQTSPTMAGIFVRGLTGNKVNVFVDGVRYSNGAQRGGVNTFLDLIEPDGLETIEVLRGPSSAQYGSDALGGSIQFFSKPPTLGVTGGPRWRGTLNASGGSSYRYGSGSGVIGYTGPSLGVTGTLSGRRAGSIRPGGGIDSHAAVTRFLGLSSDVLMDARLPDTGFWQIGGAGRANWKLDPRTNLVASYIRTTQDDGKRYDQLLGGDGNLIADLNDLSLDLLSLRLERLGVGPFDHASFSYLAEPPARGACEPGRQWQSHGDDRPRAGTDDGQRLPGNGDHAAVAASDADFRWGSLPGRSRIGFVQRQPHHRRRLAAPSPRSRRRDVHAGRCLRSDGIRRGSRSTTARGRAAVRRRELPGRGVGQSDRRGRAAVA